MSNLDLTIAEIMHGDTEVLKIMKGDVQKWPPVVSVSGVLTHVTSSTPLPVYINKGGSFTTFLTTDTNYDITNVTIMMGSVDISSTAYLNGTISIPSVTDDVVITVVAEENITLPYDAEVEYLRSDGNAYIDIDVDIASTVTFDIQITLTSATKVFVFGGSDGTSKRIGLIIGNNNNSLNWRWGGSLQNVTELPVAGDYSINNLSSPNIVMVNQTSITAPTSTFSSTNSLHLLGQNSNGSHKDTPTAMRLKSAKFYSNGVLERDFIPVRTGTIGYLYDKVSKTLFGNAGSGNFSYGNDV